MCIARFVIGWRIPALCVLATSLGAAFSHAETPDIPIGPGVNFVLAVDNGASPQATKKAGILQGDYEMVVMISAVSADGITQIAIIDGFDEAGAHKQGSVPRLVLPADLANSHLQVFGFHSDDPAILRGTTALGPSLAVTRELLETGTTAYSFRNFSGLEMVSGTLTRSAASHVKFPVLINGKRVALDAIYATGQMSSGSARRPFETYILDHPRYPLSLRIAYGPRDGAIPFQAHFAREIVRIDFPEQQTSLAEALEKDCRVEVPGVYFDFNLATLKPQSQRALQGIATALQKAPQRPVRVEGHTDNIGSDSYNYDLSARRAAAVKTALVRDFGVGAAQLSTAGYGERRPIESNDTLAGRAHNRRVELVCAGGQ